MKTFITFLCTIIGIGLIYYLLFEDYSTLFYVNMITGWVTAGIIISNIPLFSQSKLLNFKNAASMLVLDVFAFILFAWVCIYTFGMEHQGESHNTLYVGMLIVFVLSTVALGVTEVGGGVMHKQEVKLQNSVGNKKRVQVSVDLFWNDFKSFLSDNTDWEYDTLKLIKSVLEHISAIPSEKIERNNDIETELTEKFDKLIALAKSWSAAENKEDIQDQITDRIQQLKKYVVTFKTIM